MLIGSTVFMGPKCYVVQCNVNVEENSPNLLLPFGFRHLIGVGPSHGHRQHAQEI